MLPHLVTQVPGPRSRELSAKLSRYEAREVTWMTEEFPIFWERAEGTNIWDADGNRFLDFTAAFAVTGLGHGSPVLREALISQAGKLVHAMGDVHPASLKADLCEALSRATFERWNVGVGKSFLGNSGSDAVEAALKTALLYSGKPGVISFTGGYHGLGYGALDAIGLPYFEEPFRRQLGRFSVKLPYPSAYSSQEFAKAPADSDTDPFPPCDLQELERDLEDTLKRHEIGCILVEPIQGRGGEVVPPREFLRLLRKVCDEHKILLILDEIYTGFNRTGTLFACDHSSVVPDIICLGKALTGGFPLSACVGRGDVMDAWPASRGEALHTSTTLGSPLGCALALVAIEEHLKPETNQMALEAGRRLHQALSSLNSPHVGRIRGVGAMLGLELIKEDRSPYGELSLAIMLAGLKDGLILLGGGPNGNILSFSPPFTLSDDEADFLARKLQEYLTSLPGSIS